MSDRQLEQRQSVRRNRARDFDEQRARWGLYTAGTFFLIGIALFVPLFLYGKTLPPFGPATTAILLIASGTATVSNWKRLARASKVAAPEIAVSSSDLSLGEPFATAYRQSVRAPVVLESASVSLVLRESVVFFRGTVAQRESHDIVAGRFESPRRNCRAGDEIVVEGRFTVPGDGMPTVVAAHNRIEWFLQYRVFIAGLEEMKQEYPLRVRGDRYLMPHGPIRRDDLPQAAHP